METKPNTLSQPPLGFERSSASFRQPETGHPFTRHGYDMAENTPSPVRLFGWRNMKNAASGPRKKPPALPVPRCTAEPVGGSFPVIAMAASVGGLNALSVILGGLPADFPAAIAIVMHLSPVHKSFLSEILSKRSLLKVKQAKTGDYLCQSCVFVAPPNHHLLVAGDGCLELSSSSAEKVNFARPSAEPLFVSVAHVYGKKAIAVVLTGGDGDGSFGVQIIKDEGGQTIAQDRPTSQDFSMPRTSIQTGDVDFILPLDEIGPKLIELVDAGTARNNGRTAAKPRGKTPARTSRVTPRYPAGPKDGKIPRTK